MVSKMDVTGKRVLVAGSGKSGIAAAELLKEKQNEVILFEGNREADLAALRERAPVFADVDILLGELEDSDLERVDLAVISPGIPIDAPAVEKIRQKKIPIWGEIELAYHFAKGPIAAITGTNGKTTTTALAGAIMASYFKDVKVVGNIGIPYTSVAADTTEETVTVAEISSFQLETTHSFHPNVSAILNITPDHLDRHHTMECYIRTKERIAENQTAEEVCVLNYEDEALREFGADLNCRALFFSSGRRLGEGLYLEEGSIYHAMDGKREKVLAVDELNILGTHNHENAMAATGVALSMGVPMEKIRESLRAFQAVEHRMEYVAEIGGVRYYNDSKGTNPDAAIKAISAMDRPTYLIGGGYDKQSDYDEWILSFGGKVRKLVLIGQTREKIAECARRHGFFDVELCGSLEEAVDLCHRNAKSGEAVLLSPACASWGMFKDYEERGRVFKEYVRSLQ